MSDTKIFHRTVYHTSKYDLNFFMYEPKVEREKNETYLISYNPILQFRYLDQNGRSDASSTYQIYPRSIYRVVEFFNTILNWFTDPNMKDLFMYNEENHLVFNSDYKSLYAYLEIPGNTKAGVMRAIPTVGNYDNGEVEAIYLYINRDVNRIMISYEELKTLFGLLKNFSFYNEINVALYSMTYCQNNNSVTTRDYNTQFKTPFSS